MHVDPDLLALLALGEEVARPSDRDHIAGCPTCAEDLKNLSRAATIGRSTLDAGELIEPAPRVWSRIAEEVGLPAEPAVASAVVSPLPERSRRRWMPALVAACVAVGLASGALITWAALRPASETVLASATLDAFPAWPGASGTAQVTASPDGGRTISVELDDPDSNDGYREVWLITSDTTKLVSLGVVRGSEGTFTIPDGIDITSYDLVDISAEPFDGDPAHSGDSIVRGQLN